MAARLIAGPSAWETDVEELLDTLQAARWLQITPNTLAKHRCRGTGPKFVRAGPGKQSPVRYRPRDLEAWLVEAMSTSENTT